MDSLLFDENEFLQDEDVFLSAISDITEKKLTLDEKQNTIIFISGFDGHFDKNTNLPIKIYKSTSKYGCFQTFFNKIELAEGIIKIMFNLKKKTKIDTVVVMSLLDAKYFFPPENEDSAQLFDELIFSVGQLLFGFKLSGVSNVKRSYVELITENFQFINLENIETPSYTLEHLKTVNIDLLVFFPPINGFYKEKNEIITKIKPRFIIDEYTLKQGALPTNDFIGFSINVEKRNYDYDFESYQDENPTTMSHTHLFGIFEEKQNLINLGI